MQPQAPIPSPPDALDGRPEFDALRFGFGRFPGLRGELLILGFFALATVVLTWPIAITLNQATGLRGDYFNNIWNVWWLKESLSNGHSPYYTDYMYFPGGISLLRHTLSPLNALPGVVLSFFLGSHAVFNVLLLATFTASAWTFSLLARSLTGSLAGALLAGLIYSFNPFHYFYICQVNVFSFQWMPLVLLFFLRTWRYGGWKNMVLAGLFTGCLAGSAEYFVMYAVIVCGLMFVLAPLHSPGVPWWTGAKRLLGAGALAGIFVAIIAAPLLWGTFGPESKLPASTVVDMQKRRQNDLLGFHWIGGPEVVTLSWPTMLGYSTLALILFSSRRIWKRHGFWIAVAALFFVLGLGDKLKVAQQDTGIPLVYGLFRRVPGLEMLRKPDRAFFMVMFVTALLAAEAWRGLARRFSSPRARAGTFVSVTALVMLELTGVPFHRYDYEPPAWLHELAKDDSVESVIELPPMSVDVMNARFIFFQTVHHKKGPLGYCTALAKRKPQEDQMDLVVNAYLQWINGIGHGIPKWSRKQGIDRMIMYKTWPVARIADPTVHTKLFFRPFFLLREKMVGMRQMGQYLDEPIEGRTLFLLKGLMRRDVGPVIYEDDDLMVFDLTRGMDDE